MHAPNTEALVHIILQDCLDPLLKGCPAWARGECSLQSSPSTLSCLIAVCQGIQLCPPATNGNQAASSRCDLMLLLQILPTSTAHIYCSHKLLTYTAHIYCSHPLLTSTAHVYCLAPLPLERAPAEVPDGPILKPPRTHQVDSLLWTKLFP